MLPDAIFLAVTEGWNSNMRLPVCEISYQFCHLILQECFTALLTSKEVRDVSTSGILNQTYLVSIMTFAATVIEESTFQQTKK